jgi:hypothetical protein
VVEGGDGRDVGGWGSPDTVDDIDVNVWGSPAPSERAHVSGPSSPIPADKVRSGEVSGWDPPFPTPTPHPAGEGRGSDVSFCFAPFPSPVSTKSGRDNSVNSPALAGEVRHNSVSVSVRTSVPPAEPAGDSIDVSDWDSPNPVGESWGIGDSEWDSPDPLGQGEGRLISVSVCTSPSLYVLTEITRDVTISFSPSLAAEVRFIDSPDLAGQGRDVTLCSSSPSIPTTETSKEVRLISVSVWDSAEDSPDPAGEGWGRGEGGEERGEGIDVTLRSPSPSTLSVETDRAVRFIDVSGWDSAPIPAAEVRFSDSPECAGGEGRGRDVTVRSPFPFPSILTEITRDVTVTARTSPSPDPAAEVRFIDFSGWDSPDPDSYSAGEGSKGRDATVPSPSPPDPAGEGRVISVSVRTSPSALLTPTTVTTGQAPLTVTVVGWHPPVPFSETVIVLVLLRKGLHSAQLGCNGCKACARDTSSHVHISLTAAIIAEKQVVRRGQKEVDCRYRRAGESRASRVVRCVRRVYRAGERCRRIIVEK